MCGRAEEREAAELLERAVGYALCSVRPVTPDLLTRPTPCRDWDLRELLWHANDSLAALWQGAAAGQVGLPPPTGAAGDGEGQDGDGHDGEWRGRQACGGGARGGEACGGEARGGDGGPVEAFRAHATRLLGLCTGRTYGRREGLRAGPRTGRVITVDGWPLATSCLLAAGALEIAVHGWDIARAAGPPRPIPPALATALLRTARELVPEPAARHPLFAPAVTVPPYADPGDRLVAFLGRDPARW